PEVSVQSHWKTSNNKSQLPTHAIVRFMPYDRFQLLLRYIRIFDPVNIPKFPSTDSRLYGRVMEWSDHIQQASLALFIPGLCVAVDECMVRFTGRSAEITKIPTKP